MSDGEAILDGLRKVETALAKKGFRKLSPWWREAFIRFYMSGGKRQLVLRVGRRGGKSSTLCLLAIVIALYGKHAIQLGDVGVIAFVSVSKDESSSRLRTIEEMLRALGVAYKRQNDSIALEDRPIIFKTFAASIAGVSGFTAIAVFCDEVSKWLDRESGANPATEVLASLRPTIATMPNARIFLSSSPLSTLDAHFDAFELGDTDTQMVAHAPTWVANPTIAEEETRRIEPNERVWLREFAAIPVAALSGAFEHSLIEAAFSHGESFAYNEGEPVVIIDASSGRGDAFTWVTVRWRWPIDRGDGWLRRDLVHPDGHVIGKDLVIVQDENGNYVKDPNYRRKTLPILTFGPISAIEGKFHGVLTADDIVRRIAQDCRRAGVRRVIGDQRENLSLEALFAQHGLRYTSVSLTGSSKPQAVERVRRLFADKCVSLVRDDNLVRELHAYSEKITSSGVVTYAARNAGHDDRVALLITAGLADLEGHLPLSPVRRSSRRIEHSDSSFQYG